MMNQLLALLQYGSVLHFRHKTAFVSCSYSDAGYSLSGSEYSNWLTGQTNEQNTGRHHGSDKAKGSGQISST
jgi:hypothetical protein